MVGPYIEQGLPETPFVGSLTDAGRYNKGYLGDSSLPGEVKSICVHSHNNIDCEKVEPEMRPDRPKIMRFRV